MPDLSWRTHLFRRRPGRGLAGLVLLALALVLVQAAGRTPLLTVLGGLVLLIAVWPFYVPVGYRLDADGVTVDHGLWRRRWPWSRFRAYAPLDEGVLLSPFRSHRRLERYRAVVLLCPGRVEEICAHLPPALIRRDDGKGA